MNTDALPGLELPAPRRRMEPAPAQRVGDVIVVPLPRWDTDWQIKTDRKGWPKLRYDKHTGKWVKVKWRPVWDPLWGNPRSNTHWQRSKAVPVVIAAVMRAATAAGLKPCSFMTVRLVWAPGDNRHADEDNLYRIFKTCCDGLARGPRKDLPGLRLVPDDNSQYMDKLAPRIARDVPAGLWIEVQCRE